MATLTISLRTDYLPSQINNVDILIADRRDISQTQFRIMTDFPDHLNLRDGVVLTKFGHLEEGADYNFTLRVFLNEQPNVVHKNVIARIDEPESESMVVINAS
jgi:hypothetical protein